MMEGNIECHPFPFFDNLTTPPDLLCYDLEICVAVELPPSPFKLPLHPAEKEEYLVNIKILRGYICSCIGCLITRSNHKT